MLTIDRLLIAGASLLLVFVNWLAFHDLFEAHTVRDWLLPRCVPVEPAGVCWWETPLSTVASGSSSIRVPCGMASRMRM
jgi:hypothetical protein